MPGAHQVAGKNFGQAEAVEAAGIGAIVCRRATYQGLHQKQHSHHHEVLHQCALPRAGVPRQPLRAHLPSGAHPAQIVELTEHQQHRGDAAQQRNQAKCTPQQRTAGGAIPDAGIGWEVVGIGVAGAGAIGHGSPCRPADEGSELLQLLRIRDEVRYQAPVRFRVLEIVGPAMDLLAICLRLR